MTCKKNMNKLFFFTFISMLVFLSAFSSIAMANGPVKSQSNTEDKENNLLYPPLIPPLIKGVTEESKGRDEGLPDEEIQRIQIAYENITDIKGNFIQKSFIKDLKRTDTYKGQFFIKMPMKVRWNYKGEVAQEVFINDDEILIYQKKERQALRGKFDRATYGQSPIALLSGFRKIQEEFTVSKKNGNLLLKPKNTLGGVLSIEIEPSQGEFPISSFIIRDKRSNIIEIILKDVEVNTGLKDALFKPSLPGDVKIYEHNPGD
jgi:outer membrane lipoprotein carrier protein